MTASSSSPGTPRGMMGPPGTIIVGCKTKVKKETEDGVVWRLAEVLSIRPSQKPGVKEDYYVHYCEFNKRLDEWIPSDLVDRSHIEPPAAKAAPIAEGKKSTVKKSKTKKGATSTTAPPPVPVPIQPDSPKHAGQKRKQTEEETTHGGAPSKEEELEHLRHGGSMTMRREEVSRVKNIQSIVLGAYQLDTWYFSPYPAPFSYADTVYICEFCLSYFDSRKRMTRHRAKCPLHHPPGNEIYRKDNISFFEVDGHKQRHYCRNLCLLSKLFLDHKTLYYDVNPFLFYVMTVNDELGCHIIGYFSKEKESADNYNVACILTLPSHQRKGYGKVLIAFSYELSKTEGKIGSPEKPLSDLGLLSYRSYWSEVLIDLLVQYPGDDISIDDLSRITAFTVEDILHTLTLLNVIKLYKNNHIICLDKKALDTYEKNKNRKARIDPSYLRWTPPMFTQSQLRYI